MPEPRKTTTEIPIAEEPKLHQTLMEDIRTGNLPATLRKDLQETYQFYLDEDRRESLQDMGAFKRWLIATWWLIKSMFLKLSPTRRIMLVVGLIIAIAGMPEQGGQILLGLMTVLFVLFLELKDKLLAQDELLAGRAVQLSLMPERHPSLPGWETWLFSRPANDVGGDMVDFLHVERNRLGLSLGDVAGKGLPAALLMAKLQATLRALVPLADSLDALGRETNRILCRDGLPDRFASLVHLEISGDSNKVRLLNAGHLPPLILREDRIETMPRGAPAFGLTPASRYEEHTVELEYGDMLVVYSDGLTEARDEQGDFYGERKLRRFLPHIRGLSPETAGARLLAEIETFVGEAKVTDDLSIILLKRTD
jgi:hypothetical protein